MDAAATTGATGRAAAAMAEATGAEIATGEMDAATVTAYPIAALASGISQAGNSGSLQALATTRAPLRGPMRGL